MVWRSPGAFPPFFSLVSVASFFLPLGGSVAQNWVSIGRGRNKKSPPPNSLFRFALLWVLALALCLSVLCEKGREPRCRCCLTVMLPRSVGAEW
ncbi:hypothetical protein FA10DRAFT_112807 [Acaromyces ingoldii]|uniref:Uncharacterized protein n=1 Tax=Acaromyces ingoldii TaxID=215250 RepID=A0A316YMJ4_9BASI|nr:hypothetical protein FA10DRAFT_112807 [Acaromyces ingoldii]PWN90421.1 hypothetical protein FA10DRAFT_112807 [Acaromyces ingoldii]